MRMCLKVQIPADGGVQITEEGLPGTLKSLLDRLQPEAAYFFPQDGMRTMMLFFDMQDTSIMPVVTRPLFDELNAEVMFSPAMNLDDLMSGLKQLQNSNR